MINNSFLPYALPEIGEEEIAEVIDTLRSGWVTTGPKTQKFEENFAKFIGSGVKALAVNSATAGLHLALEAIGISAGDEVIVPTYTFTATAEVVRYLGAHPICVDVDPITCNITPTAICSAITSKTKAIIPVHFAGLACQMDEIISVAQQNNLKIIEDAAHALPTLYKGKLIGALGSNVSVFSFYANKTMTTGEGGMLVSRDQKIIERCKTMRLHGISRDAFDRYISTKPSWFYEVIAPGFKYNMTDIAAAIGLHQLAKLEQFQKRRALMAQRYQQELSNLPLILPALPQADSSHAWHLYPVRLTEKSPILRDDFINKMATLGIGCSVHFIPLHRQPVWRDTYHLKAEDFPIAEQIYQHEVSLPLYSKMSDTDQERVINAVHNILQK